MLLVRAGAKINWTLDVLGKRPDGYHLLDMLMASVSLCDSLLLAKAEVLTLQVEGEASLAQEGTGTDGNLVMKAAKALQAATGCQRGAAMRLQKRIPVGAGMGGGSADAAAALLGLCRLWGLTLSSEALQGVALSLGADVPFLLTGGLARVRGIGERLQPLATPPPSWLVVTQPCQGLSTPEVFQAFDALAEREGVARPHTHAAQAALLAGDLPALARAMGNGLQQVSISQRPAIGQAIRALEGAGALRGMMTGSGSAVYGVFTNETTACKAYAQLAKRWPCTHVIHTTPQSVTMEESSALAASLPWGQ